MRLSSTVPAIGFLAIDIKPERLVWSTDTLEVPSVFAAIWRLE
jgi:hypothetical protein